MFLLLHIQLGSVISFLGVCHIGDLGSCLGGGDCWAAGGSWSSTAGPVLAAKWWRCRHSSWCWWTGGRRSRCGGFCWCTSCSNVSVTQTDQLQSVVAGHFLNSYKYMYWHPNKCKPNTIGKVKFLIVLTYSLGTGQDYFKNISIIIMCCTVYCIYYTHPWPAWEPIMGLNSQSEFALQPFQDSIWVSSCHMTSASVVSQVHRKITVDLVVLILFIC